MKEDFTNLSSNQGKRRVEQNLPSCIDEEEVGEFRVPAEWHQIIVKCAGAEDFFNFFQLPFDDSVLAVNRLHILRRFGERLIEIDPYLGLVGPKAESISRYLMVRSALAESYEEFLAGGPLDYRVFRVLQNTAEAVPIPLGNPRRSVNS